MEKHNTIGQTLWKLASLNKTEQLLILSLHHCHQKCLKTSRKSLARMSGRSLSAVHKALDTLESLDIITKKTRKDEDGAYLPSTYAIIDEVILSILKERG
jgi:predicted transcriptional regulator